MAGEVNRKADGGQKKKTDDLKTVFQK